MPYRTRAERYVLVYHIAGEAFRDALEMAETEPSYSFEKGVPALIRLQLLSAVLNGFPKEHLEETLQEGVQYYHDVLEPIRAKSLWLAKITGLRTA